MTYRKYPRTLNLPWSGSNSSDDVWLKNCDHFTGKEVVMLEKLDGENTNLYSDHIHARSADGGHGVGRAWVKALHGAIKHEIPPNWKVVGENMYAAHSIWYWGLETYFYVFGVFEEEGGEERCLSWDDVKSVAEVLGLLTVPEVYRGPFDEAAIRSAWDGSSFFETYNTPADHVPTENPVPTTGEGYVIRSVEAFACRDFSRNVAKMVRAGHVQTTQHWAQLPVLPNRLRPQVA